ncbi:hypothetical protein GIB67_042636 [Kingdonia uniflora]|uniref:Uncharacterized protein n=1 Tax=Kingdonia uniflora TaxID=39325 RepID=A0A7J7M1E7_9MAGN|nr:hypothetical protein GIB67_042636 [Kingdonia uniflora]
MSILTKSLCANLELKPCLPLLLLAASILDYDVRLRNVSVSNSGQSKRVSTRILQSSIDTKAFQLNQTSRLPYGAQLRKHIDATLGSGNLREAVRLPPGEDPNEWLAVNILSVKAKLNQVYCALFFYFPAVDFFNQVNLLYGTLTEFCTSENCPTVLRFTSYITSQLHIVLDTYSVVNS